MAFDKEQKDEHKEGQDPEQIPAQMSKEELELSQDFTFWSLFKYVGPSIFTFIFIAVYQMVDGAFIEHYVGELAISAINLYYPIITFYIAVGVMIGTGGNAVIVKKVGEGKRKEAGQTFSRVISFTLLLGILFTVVSLVFADPIMRICGATAGNIEYLRPYYMTLTAFCIAILLQTELGILIIGEGKTVTAAIVVMVGGVINCVLDYIFMKYLHMGIRGAAIATVIGYSSTLVYAIWFYVIARKSSYYLEVARPDWKEMGGICFNGSSDMVSNLAEAVTVLFMNHLAYRCYGETGVSSLAVVTYVQVLISMVCMGFTSAVEPIFSYHYGSGNVPMRKKVYRLSMRWNVVLGIATIIVLYPLRNALVGFFFDPGTEFYEIAMVGYLYTLPAALFTGINVFGSGLFTAFGNGLVSASLSLIRTFIVITACLFGLTALFGGPGLWAAWAVAEMVSLIPTFYAIRKFRGRYQYL